MVDKELIEELRLDEGVRKFPYDDATGKAPEAVGKISIGAGRNLTDVGLSDDEIDYLMGNDIERVESALDAKLPWWRNLDRVRQRVLKNMCYNMGIDGLLTFKNTLAQVEARNFTLAADNMMKSRWATQVKGRAERLSFMMRTGVRHEIYRR